MNAQTGIAFLELGEGIIGLHGSIERARRNAEFVVEFPKAIQRNLSHEKAKILFLQCFTNLFYGLVGEISVGRNIDLADMVLPDKLPADFAELGSQERLASREVKIFDTAERAREGNEFFRGEIITPVQVAPVEA